MLLTQKKIDKTHDYYLDKEKLGPLENARMTCFEMQVGIAPPTPNAFMLSLTHQDKGSLERNKKAIKALQREGSSPSLVEP